MKGRVAIFALLALQTACIPVAFVTPPIELQAGAAAHVHEDTSVAVPIRVDAQPMQLVESQKDRKYDFGIGYLFLPGTGPYLHGPGLNVGILQGESSLPRGEETGLAFRWGATMRTNLMYEGSGFGNNGWGVGLQAHIEWVRYSSGPFAGCNDDEEEYYPPPAREPSQDPYPENPDWDDDDEPAISCFVGYAEGEGGFGLFVEGSHAQISGQDFSWFGGGLLFRLPASGGVGFATIF